MEERVHVVLKFDDDGEVVILGVYRDEERANSIVAIERSCHEDVWYQSEYLT